MATSPAVAAKPAAAPASVPQAPADPLTGYYRAVRQMNLQLAKDRYKQGFKVRTQEYIRGRGTLAVVDEEICMGCTHCFDNCAFESIGMVDRKFALPEYSYTSRKAIIIEENCVGCEKCAIVCPVDAITMVTKHGFEVKDGRVVSTTPAAPLAPRPAAATPTTTRPTAVAPAPAPKPAAPVPAIKPAATPPTAEAPAPKPPPKPEPKTEEESAEPSEEPTEEETEEETPDEEGGG